MFDEKAGELDLQGWVTLTHGSRSTVDAPDTQLVAGQVQLTSEAGGGERQPDPGRAPRRGPKGRTGPGQALGDYYIYTLPERTTIAQSQTKQVELPRRAGRLGAQGLSVSAPRRLRERRGASSAAVAVDFANSTAGGLGAGLPAGTIRVYQRDAAGEPKFVGENSIDHTPQGSELAIKIGDAFDVTAQPTAVAIEKVSKTRTRYSMSYLVRNARSEPVTVELRQAGYWGRDTKVVSESLPSRRIDAATLGWSVPVPANGETTLTSVVETGW